MKNNNLFNAFLFSFLPSLLLHHRNIFLLPAIRSIPYSGRSTDYSLQMKQTRWYPNKNPIFFISTEFWGNDGGCEKHEKEIRFG